MAKRDAADVLRDLHAAGAAVDAMYEQEHQRRTNGEETTREQFIADQKIEHAFDRALAEACEWAAPEPAKP